MNKRTGMRKGSLVDDSMGNLMDMLDCLSSHSQVAITISIKVRMVLESETHLSLVKVGGRVGGKG
jgi:hypothetical protein